MQGILNEFVAHDYGTAAKNYERSIALIDLGRSRWRGLSTGLIGTSFEETFRARSRLGFLHTIILTYVSQL